MHENDDSRRDPREPDEEQSEFRNAADDDSTPGEESAGLPAEPEDEEVDDAEGLRTLEFSAETIEHMPLIPLELHSDFEDAPFSKCIVCDRLLLEQSRVYHVEKVLRGSECVFENALCIDCAANLHRQYSKESKKALRKFFMEFYEPSQDTSICHLCRQPAGQGSDRVLTGACVRDRLVLPMVVVCSQCLEKTQALLSAKTRETLRDFIETNFPGVPAEWEPSPIFAV